ncbi:DUF3566 domain-containing protein [Nocardioides sp. TRM66260-LWL]|uniref:DUF3566 domain-containing protein n=1 Tax=Nocardioides sp. TRM66260-LWL TaxID=2874478 RepID=UPI001CC6379C|nr:DUF3566 domain-containing protein [Nocardioides sp. TRM66260-LWL]MBZ5735546.1 DUF3566 domain-containing protein [Nocardioides sp. TRM66260-LWL]
MAGTARSDDTAAQAPATEQLNTRLQSMAEAGGPAAKATADARRNPRRARLRLSTIDPWSVMKTSFLLAVAFAIVSVVAVLMVWTVLSAAGVWESINQTVRDIVGGDTAQRFDVTDYLGTSRVLGFTMVVSAINVVLITAVATLAAFLYNMAASLLGGIEVTLSEDA